MEANRKAVEMANVERPKVMMKGIVEERIVNGEVAWGVLVAQRRRG